MANGNEFAPPFYAVFGRYKGVLDKLLPFNPDTVNPRNATIKAKSETINPQSAKVKAKSAKVKAFSPHFLSGLGPFRGFAPHISLTSQTKAIYPDAM